MRISDWSSDVCSSDLGPDHVVTPGAEEPKHERRPLEGAEHDRDAPVLAGVSDGLGPAAGEVEVGDGAGPEDPERVVPLRRHVHVPALEGRRRHEEHVLGTVPLGELVVECVHDLAHRRILPGPSRAGPNEIAATWRAPLDAPVSGRGARSLTGWGSDRVFGGWSVRPARSGGEAELGWVTSSGRAVGSGDLEDPGVIHGDVPAPPVDEVVVPGAEQHPVGELGGPTPFPLPELVPLPPPPLRITR